MKLTLSNSIVTSTYQQLTSNDSKNNHGSTNKAKVTALSYSSDSSRLAVATADRSISLYNNQGKLVDKFQTKPNGDGPKDYIVRELRFSPNAGQPKLAIAKSDAIVFVYKWKQQVNDGSTKKKDENVHVWDGKKSICNKFPEQSAITSLIWSYKQPIQIVYGLMDGKVKIGNLPSLQNRKIQAVSK